MNALLPFLARNNWTYDIDRFFEPLNETPRSIALLGDIEEDDKEITLSFDVPGLKDGDFSVQVHEDRLTISGERKKEIKAEKTKEGGYTYLGRQYGKFTKTFVLPNTVDKDNIAADYEGGVLKITLPKVEEEKPKTIEVKVKSKH